MNYVNPQANQHAGYHTFIAEDGTRYGSYEVYYRGPSNHEDENEAESFSFKPGWFWRACRPGCLPEGEAIGPFSSSRAAMNDARAL